MKFLNFNRVLCLSPHPDDVELGMLGTVLKERSTKFYILCMTICGAKGFDGSYELDRVGEIRELWIKANCSNVIPMRSDCDWFEDKTEPGWINFLDNHIKDMDYDCIFIPPFEDSMFEHRFVNSFGSTLTRKSPISLIEYHTASTLNTWIPNLFVDITPFYDRKIKLLENFTSQIDKPYFQKGVMESKCISYQCRRRGLKYVEKYRIIESYE